MLFSSVSGAQNFVLKYNAWLPVPKGDNASILGKNCE